MSYANFNADDTYKKVNNYITNITPGPFMFSQVDNKNFANMSATILKGQQVDNPVSQLFFSRENIARIQKLIKYDIYERTKHKFKLSDDQSEEDLLISMRGVYFEHGRFLGDRVVHQVKELNKRVVEYVVPDMITGIKQYYAYLRDINEPLKPMARPMNANNGKVQLPSITTAWEV